MSRRSLAGAVTTICIVTSVAALAWKRQPPVPISPQDAVCVMLDAAREGSVALYVDSYSGALRHSILQALAEQGEAKYAQYLKTTNAAIAGIAITGARDVSDSEAVVTLEYVYPNRTEAQHMTLIRESANWKITRVSAREHIPKAAPYGAPLQ